MNPTITINRRELIQTTGFLALTFAIPLSPAFGAEDGRLPGDLEDNPMLSAWLRINADETVTLMIGKVELGQGALTAFGQICADELIVDYDRIQIISGDTEISPNEGTTSGSQTMSHGGTAVRAAAAEVREILIGLAAERLGQAAEGLTVQDGTISAPNGSEATYWELVTGQELERRATGTAKLRPIAEYQYMGTSYPRVDIPAKMTGAAIFIQDMKPEGTVYGAVARPPTYVASLASIDLAPIEAMPGVIRVVRNGSFLGVLAERQDQAFAAADALGTAAVWNVESVLPGSDGIFDWLTSANTSDTTILSQQRVDDTPTAGVLEATYHRPYHMHGSIGTSAAIARLGEDGVTTIHTHSQNVFALATAVAELLGVEDGKVHCIHVQGSGCYGHNMADDAGADAALLAREVPGTPVKLQYTRPQEHQWEPYGSAMVVKTRASIDADGDVLDWNVDVWSTSHGTRPGGKAGNLLSGKYVEPPFEQPVAKDIGAPNYGAARNAIALYDFAGHEVVSHFVTEMPLRVSSTRSLGSYANLFAVESFIDEVADAAGADPLEYRLRYLKDERARDVLIAAADKFGWDDYVSKPNQGRGIAVGRYKNLAAYVAVAIEVAVTRRNGRVRVLRAVGADDSGQIINPDGIANQVEGGIIQSLSWTLKEEVRFDETSVLSRDWASYPIITFNEVPPIEVVLIDRPGEPFLGTGEAPTGPTAAALANAIFNASGARLRRIPFTPDRVKAEIDRA